MTTVDTPRWTEETAALVAQAMAAHHIVMDPSSPDRLSPCVCGSWSEGAMEPGWDDHMAEVALTALADAGLLVEGEDAS